MTRPPASAWVGPNRATSWSRRPTGGPPSTYAVGVRPWTSWTPRATPTATSGDRRRKPAHGGVLGGQRRCSAATCGRRAAIWHARGHGSLEYIGRGDYCPKEKMLVRIIVELQAQNPPPAWAGLRPTTRPRRRPWDARCTAGARRACNAHPTERKEDMYCGCLRGGVTIGRVLVPLRSPALDSMIGAVPATHGDPIVAHPSTSVRALGRSRGRARRADGRTGCVWTTRGARCARGRQKMPDYRPAGAFFYRARRAV